MQEGKGRCDLLPFEVVENFLDFYPEGDNILSKIRLFLEDNSTLHLYTALLTFAETAFNCSPETLLLEVAKQFEDGAVKYGDNNWRRGIPATVYIDSAVRHYLKWRRGDQDEPHDRAFAWNLLCCIWEVDYHHQTTGGDTVCTTSQQ
jgi:hypothetical protein